MASKGQKFNSYSSELIKEILNKYFSNQGTIGSLSYEYSIPKGTIKSWLIKYRKGGNFNQDNRGKHSAKDEAIDYKEKYEILKNYQAFLKAQREKK